MSYVFVKIPLKKATVVGRNSQSEVQIPPNERKEIEGLRKKCTDQFDNFRKQSDKGAKALDGFLISPEQRDQFVGELISNSDSYASALITLVGRNAKFGVMNYYSWSSSLCDKQDIAYDDYRYDLMCVYYNVAAVLMNLSQYVLCVRATVGTASSLEKEAYRTLLKAAGYFDLARSLVETIRKEPIGVAPFPVPIDTAVAMLTFLPAVAVAQAQEIGTTRATEADPKSTTDTAARLSNQLTILYQKARAEGSKVYTRCEDFISIATLVSIKGDVFKSLTYSHAASWAFQKNPSEGLWFLDKSKKCLEVVEAYQKALTKGKLQISYKIDLFLQGCCAAVKRNDERLTKINSLVHHAKPAAGSLSLPEPQVLAASAEVRLPVELAPK